MGGLLEVGTGFHPELTGRENIYLNGGILGMGKREISRKFDEIVAFSEVEPFLDTPVKRYSSGMHVRLAFAVASHLEPEILLVDEVLAVGDTKFQKKCLGRMNTVAGHGRTVLFVSHNLGAVTGLCQTGVWLDSGSLRFQGPVREAVDLYLKDGVDRAGATIDLAITPRNFPARGLHILGVEWRSGVPLQHGEPLSVRIHFDVQSPVEDVSLGIGFSTPEGTRLLSYDTDLAAPRHALSARRELYADLHVQALPLAPGLYALDVGARSGDAYGLDYLAACALVEVCPGSTTPPMLTRFPGSGVRLPGDWSSNAF